ncbi:MAG: M20 family metallopeptidase [Bacteroidia bacterium]|nr:M20 family metallopeptidase [Bacteroidia bacterium]
MSLQAQIQDLSAEIYEEVVANRRHIHANPELSFHEEKTAAFVQEKLEDIGIPVTPNIADNGLVGIIEGTKEGEDKVLALRADMDALPIIEENEVAYKSQNPGVMHACGHDVHTSSLLGTAKILNQFRDKFSGTIKLIFQPAEELLPGGASLMIKDGVLENPKVSSILGQHVQPYMDCGKIGVRPGMYMASADEIHMVVKGKGGHAAMPANFIDPIMMTAQMLVTLQQVVSRSDPRIPSVLSFGDIHGDGATNVIPSEVRVKGTFRTMNEAWRDKALNKIEKIITNTAESLGGSVELEIKKGYPVLYNDEILTRNARAHICDYIGEEHVVDMDIWMAAEDFAWYTQEIPGCFYRLGTRNESRGIVHGVHTPRFDIDEDALKLSTGLMAWLAIKELE